MQPQHTFIVAEDTQMVLAVMRQNLPEKPSWTAVRKLLRARRVAIGGVLCVDEGRKLSKGEVLSIFEQPLPPPPSDEDVKVHFVDRDLVVAEKPTSMVTLRRKQDLNPSTKSPPARGTGSAESPSSARATRESAGSSFARMS